MLAVLAFHSVNTKPTGRVSRNHCSCLKIFLNYCVLICIDYFCDIYTRRGEL